MTTQPVSSAAARLSDDELMARLAAGADSALEELVARHRDRLIRLGVRSLGDRASAEDVAQETFLRVVRHAPAYRPHGHFTSWLLAIASRLCLNVARDRSRRPEVPLAALPDPAGRVSPERSVELRELHEAMARLRPRHRMALVLKAVEGLSYREIARVLGCSETDVANFVFRARKALARELAPR